MATILVFHPDLQHLFPPQIRVEASPLSALKLLANQHPLKDKIEPVPVKFREINNMELAETNFLTDRTFHVDPFNLPVDYVYAGSGGGSGGWLTAVLGVVLVIVAAPVGLSLLGEGMLASFVTQLGIGLALSGLMQLLAPSPELSTEGEQKKSRYFSGKNTTVAIGTPIQMVFGRRRVFGHLLSLNIDARNYEGVDDPENSPYFSQKADENLPNYNIQRFYGIVRVAQTTKLVQIDNNVNRTGTQV